MWRERIGQIVSAACGAAAVAVTLTVFYQPMVDPCNICEQMYPWWLCILLGCW